ncbi:TonB-dependent receptor [Daejeonella lutea]|uniref:TonB dependent receptor n=1 Tax=Daejeonella lutea TaxID=572036 RepID=A0A1T5A1N8_9SPHI|nr:TonB-dependent receptor [Daejeonella lutea]SKB28888.1 TonB dependent receptor [Daejeonella lutea]
MKIPFLKYAFLVCFSTLSVSVMGQDKPNPTPPSGTLTEEIEVVRPYKPVLADAVKIRRSPDLKNEQPYKAALTYNIIDKKLELNSNIKELEAQKMVDEKEVVLRNNYAKAAAGSSGTTLGEVYVNTGRDQGLQAGAFFKHLSQQGDQERQQFSTQQLGLFGRTVSDSYSLSGKLMYDRRSTYFYGFNPVSSATVNMDKQRFGTIIGQAELINNFTESSPLDYALNIKAYQFSNIDEGRESSVVLGGSVNKAMNLLNFGLNASADFTAVKDEAYKMGNSILRANPYVKLQGKAFSLNIGANIVQEFGDRSRTNVFPAVSAEIPVVTDYAILFGGVNGDVLKTSLRDLATENPYLSKNISIANSIEKMNIYAGIKGNAGAEFGYKVLGFYKTVEDLLLFVNNPTTINRFDAIYDNGESKIFGLNGQVNVKASEILSLTGKAEIYNYELASENEAWFKPTLRFSSNARFDLNEKVIIDGELLFQGETTAKFPGPASGPVNIVNIKSFMDISAGAEYRVNNKFGVFLRANNLLGKSYQKYLYYPKLGMNLFGGVNYSF